VAPSVLFVIVDFPSHPAPQWLNSLPSTRLSHLTFRRSSPPIFITGPYTRFPFSRIPTGVGVVLGRPPKTDSQLNNATSLSGGGATVRGRYCVQFFCFLLIVDIFKIPPILLFFPVSANPQLRAFFRGLSDFSDGSTTPPSNISLQEGEREG